jgi:hypothetical protein
MKKRYFYVVLPLLVLILFFSVAALCNFCTIQLPEGFATSTSSAASTVSEITKETGQEISDLNPATTSTAVETPSSSSSQNSVTENTGDTQKENAISPSGAPIITLEGGSGYLFQSSSTVTGSNDRDIWWNAVYFVPNSLMMSFGVINSPNDIKEISVSAMKRDQVAPVLGGVYAVEVENSNSYAIIRVLSIDSEAKISFEYIYPFGGEILQ